MRINYQPKEGRWIAFRAGRRETMTLMLSGFQLDASGRLQTDRPDIAARFFSKCCPFGQEAIRQHRIAAREAEKEAILLVVKSDDRREIEEKLQAIRPEKQQGKLLVHIGERGRFGSFQLSLPASREAVIAKTKGYMDTYGIRLDYGPHGMAAPPSPLPWERPEGNQPNVDNSAFWKGMAVSAY